MNAETYEVVSFEEMEEARLKSEEATAEFNRKYKNFLITCLCNVGFANNLVRVKQTGALGVLRVEERGYYYTRHPYDIKFYPIKKDGSLSVKSKYVSQFNMFHLDKCTQELLNSFELVVTSDES